jgi:outer membrane protein OmpA-like peptidoglycan-associated protein
MKLLATVVATICSSLTFSAVAGGYVLSQDGQPVRDGYGQCVKTGTWSATDRLEACDGPTVTAKAVKRSLNADVLFGFNQVKLTTAGQSELKQVASAIKPGSVVTIVGYADPIGDEQYNLPLSEARAAVVTDFLAELVTAEFEPRGVGSGMTGAGLIRECDNLKSWNQRVQCYSPARKVEVIYTAR